MEGLSLGISDLIVLRCGAGGSPPAETFDFQTEGGQQLNTEGGQGFEQEGGT